MLSEIQPLLNETQRRLDALIAALDAQLAGLETEFPTAIPLGEFEIVGGSELGDSFDQ